MSPSPRVTVESRALIVTNMWPTEDDPAFGVFVRDQVEALRARIVDAALSGQAGVGATDVPATDVPATDVPATDVPATDIPATDARAIDARLTNSRSTGIRAIDVCIIDGRRNRLAYAFGVLRLRRMLARSDRRYVLVHAHHALAGFAAILAGARRPDRPLLVTHHGIEVLEGWQAPLCRWVSARADRTLVTSPALAERLGGSSAVAGTVEPAASIGQVVTAEPIGGSSAGADTVEPAASIDQVGSAEPFDGAPRAGLAAIDIVPCGIDRGRFRPGDRAAARAQLGLPSHGALVAWAGTDRPEKRLWLARAAIERIGFASGAVDAGRTDSAGRIGTGGRSGGDGNASDRDPHTRLLVISGRPHAEVPTWLQAADVLVLTSTAEGSPLVVREALACGLPVVSTDVGDVRSLLEGLPGCAVVGFSESTLSATSAASTRRESKASTPTPSLPGSAAPAAASNDESTLASNDDSTLASNLARALEQALVFSATGAKVDAGAALAVYDSDAIADRVWSIWCEATQGADGSPGAGA